MCCRNNQVPHECPFFVHTNVMVFRRLSLCGHVRKNHSSETGSIEANQFEYLARAHTHPCFIILASIVLPLPPISLIMSISGIIYFYTVLTGTNNMAERRTDPVSIACSVFSIVELSVYIVFQIKAALTPPRLHIAVRSTAGKHQAQNRLQRVTDKKSFL